MVYRYRLGPASSHPCAIGITNRVAQRHAQGCRKPLAPIEPGGRTLFITAQKSTQYIPLRDPSQRVEIPGEGRVMHLVGFVLTTRIKTLDIAKLE